MLLDTDVPISLFDTHSPAKLERARSLLREPEAPRYRRLIVQCLAESANASIRRLTSQLTPAQALIEVELFQKAWPVVNLTPFIMIDDALGVCDHQLVYYEVQIWASAHLNGVRIVPSGDFQTGRTPEGMTFANPFANEFQVSDWL